MNTITIDNNTYNSIANMKTLLTHRFSQSEIKELCALTHGARNNHLRGPYAIRALCIKLAYEQMKYWSELLNELCQMLDLISNEPLSSGLRSAWRQVMKKIKA